VLPVPIQDINDPRIAPYRQVREADLRGRDRLFMAEGRFVVSLLLRDGRFPVDSVFVTQPALEAIRPAVEACDHPPPVYVAPRSLMSEIVGFDIHRGCLAAGRRQPVPSASDWLDHAPADIRLLIATEEISNHDNMGGIFRSAAAFGAGAVLVSPRCCDPLYRKAIRVSMGHALRLPYAEYPAGKQGIQTLRERGVASIALSTGHDSIAISDAARRLAADPPERVCLLLGSEGAGLSGPMIENADLRVRIPIAPGVDSLNATVAASIAMQRLAEAMGLLPGDRDG
jgi:tRNA G18 (ribose-2'-O)-methylase SpoU